MNNLGAYGQTIDRSRSSVSNLRGEGVLESRGDARHTCSCRLGATGYSGHRHRKGQEVRCAWHPPRLHVKTFETLSNKP